MNTKYLVISGSPIDCGFYAYRNVVMNYGHDMICRGFVEYENGSKYFSLIDPNSGSYVSVTSYANTSEVENELILNISVK